MAAPNPMIKILFSKTKLLQNVASKGKTHTLTKAILQASAFSENSFPVFFCWETDDLL